MASEVDDLSGHGLEADLESSSESSSSRGWSFWDSLFSNFEICESCADSCAGPDTPKATDKFERRGIGPAKTHWVDIFPLDRLEQIVEGAKSDHFDCVLCELISYALPLNLKGDWTVSIVSRPSFSLWHDRRDKNYLQRISIHWDSGRNPFQVGELVRPFASLQYRADRCAAHSKGLSGWNSQHRGTC